MLRICAISFVACSLISQTHVFRAGDCLPNRCRSSTHWSRHPCISFSSLSVLAKVDFAGPSKRRILFFDSTPLQHSSIKNEAHFWANFIRTFRCARISWIDFFSFLWHGIEQSTFTAQPIDSKSVINIAGFCTSLSPSSKSDDAECLFLGLFLKSFYLLDYTSKQHFG